MRAISCLIICFLLFASAGAYGQSDANAGGITLKGVMISPTGASAMINNRIFREGDSFSGATIVSISRSEVYLQLGQKQLTVPVGTRIDFSRASRLSVVAPPLPESGEYQVRSGDTLSEIAKAHLPSGMSLAQMTKAIYEINPAAFAGNINRLKAGAVLYLPSPPLRPDAMLATVGKQPTSSVGPAPQSMPPAPSTDAQQTWQVARGESLSIIASKLPRGEATIYQTMMALFAANPDAFRGNMNRLREGSELLVPDVLTATPPRTASAEVMRQADDWKHGGIRKNRAIEPDTMAYTSVPMIESLAKGTLMTANRQR